MKNPDITLYGIAHCDTVKKSRAWLTAKGLEHRFHDFKKLGVPPEALSHWLEQAGWGIDFRAWRPSTDGAPALPLRIDARRGDAGVRLVVDAWSGAEP